MDEFSVVTERLILRRYRPSDLQALYAILSDPVTVEYEPYRAMDLQEVCDVLDQRIGMASMIAVAKKDDDQVIGNLYFDRHETQAELGYVFNRTYWKRGYAKEACQALIDWAFTQGITEILAMCDPQNPNSWKLLEALGFTRTAHLIANVSFWTDEQGNPILKDTYVYKKSHKKEDLSLLF